MDDKLRLDEALEHYRRNRRWGTCGECPHVRDGGVYPEFCANTSRYDHISLGLKV